MSTNSPVTSTPEPQAAGEKSELAAKQAVALAEVRFGPRIGGGGGGKRISKTGCCLGALLLTLLPLGVVVYFTWFAPPAIRVYEPLRNADPATLVRLGMDTGLALPAGWERTGPTAFAGPGGATLDVRHGTVGSLRMNPLAYGGQPVRGEYTPQAYANGLRKRRRDLAEEFDGSRIRIGSVPGVEVVGTVRSGETLRAFALIHRQEEAVELLFILPGGWGSPAFAEAEAIARSFTTGLPPVVPERQSELSTPE